ncbi:hypothetical protein [Sulfuriroseicoccus oceanibius]|uniref:Arginine N-succinyltransferase n=1 Tax=Sulfuriroseicoccus oceanibius TaxID=2707525 RepID=A0A6B3L8Q8_9BACT|nr:hypothetical protein [Sulfuriroseicoccus oceanibius]QQL45777.1 hypothetical protein G3M56_004110 [Sulfuriroseicoccus oceanibius]
MSAPPPVPAAPRRRGCFFYAVLAVIGAAIVFVLGISATLWWLQRPIKPVELSAKESEVVEEKLTNLQEPESRYEEGSKNMVFTEREINGLINEHTELGDTLRIELDPDAVNAYLAVPIPEDSAILPGKQFKARARIEVELEDLDNGLTRPRLEIADVTVYGISLPNAWLGGIKGKDLGRELFGGGRDSQLVIQGVEELRIERERIEIILAE